MLAKRIIGAFHRPSCGFTKARREVLTRLLGKKELGRSKRADLKTLLAQLQRLYETPDIGTACDVIGAIAQRPPEWLAIRHPSCFQILGSLRPVERVSPKDCLRQGIQQYKRTRSKHERCASTIHKAKGLEFDHVILVGNEQFLDDLASRQVAYVALSRACESVHIIVPRKAPSPLLHS
jgi:UvrD-like helicase C-terminal domain